MLSGKGIVRTGYESKGEGITRAGYGSKRSLFKKIFDSTPSFKKYYQNETRFNGVYSRDNLHKMGHM